MISACSDAVLAPLLQSADRAEAILFPWPDDASDAGRRRWSCVELASCYLARADVDAATALGRVPALAVDVLRRRPVATACVAATLLHQHASPAAARQFLPRALDALADDAERTRRLLRATLLAGAQHAALWQAHGAPALPSWPATGRRDCLRAMLAQQPTRATDFFCDPHVADAVAAADAVERADLLALALARGALLAAKRMLCLGADWPAARPSTVVMAQARNFPVAVQQPELGVVLRAALAAEGAAVPTAPVEPFDTPDVSDDDDGHATSEALAQRRAEEQRTPLPQLAFRFPEDVPMGLSVLPARPFVAALAGLEAQRQLPDVRFPVLRPGASSARCCSSARPSRTGVTTGAVSSPSRSSTRTTRSSCKPTRACCSDGAWWQGVARREWSRSARGSFDGST